MRLVNYKSENKEIMLIAKKYKFKRPTGKSKYAWAFDCLKWEAPIIQHPDALKEYLMVLGIVGATINSIDTVQAVGELEDGTYLADFYPKHYVEGYDENRKEIYGDWNYDETVKWVQKRSFSCGVEIDEPLIIYTDKGQFEIDYCDSSMLRIDKDKIPDEIVLEKYECADYFRADKIFSCVNGLKIVDVIVDETDYYSANMDFTNSYLAGIDENQKRYIADLKLVLSNGYIIKFYNSYDWGHVCLIDDKGNDIKIEGMDIENVLGAPIGTDTIAEFEKRNKEEQ